MLKIKTLFEILPTEEDRKQFVDMLKRYNSRQIKTHPANIIRQQFITDYLGGDDYKEIQIGGETANTEAIPNIEGIDKMTMHDLFFRKLAAKHSGDESFSLSGAIQRLNVCQTVEDVDALGTELFTEEWPGAPIKTTKSLCRDNVGKWKVDGIAKAFPLFTQPFPYPELYSHVPDLRYYVKDLTQAFLFLNMECSCGLNWSIMLERYLRQDSSLTDNEKGQIRGFEHYLLLVLICMGAGRMYEKTRDEFWKRAWYEAWPNDDRDDGTSECMDRFVIQHGLEDDYLELAKHGRMDLCTYISGFTHNDINRKFHGFCTPVFDHSLRDYAKCVGLTSVNNILKPLLKGEFIKHCILDGASYTYTKVGSSVLDAPTKRVDYKDTERLCSVFMPDTYFKFLDSSTSTVAMEEFRNRIGYWPVSKELKGNYNNFKRPDESETGRLLHIKQAIKYPESNIHERESYKPCFIKDNPITEDDLYQGVARVVLTVFPEQLCDMSTYFNENIIPTLILVRTSSFSSCENYYFCVDTEEHKQLLEGLIDSAKNNSSESERAGVDCKIVVRKEIQDKMWLNADSFKDRTFGQSSSYTSSLEFDMLKETVLIRLLCSRALWDDTCFDQGVCIQKGLDLDKGVYIQKELCFDKGVNIQKGLFLNGGSRLSYSWGRPSLKILEVASSGDEFASDDLCTSYCFVNDGETLYRRRGVVNLESKICRLQDDGFLHADYVEESGLYVLPLREHFIGIFYLSEGYAMYVRYEELVDMCPAIKDVYDQVNAMSEDDLKISADLWVAFGYNG